jgi:hypothetical protein
MITVDDSDFIIAALADVSQDILQKHEGKWEEMYDRIEVELVHSVNKVPFRAFPIP